MSIINIGLQGVGIRREKAASNENNLIQCGRMKAIRQMAEKPCTELLRHVTEWPKLKDQNFQTFNPADDEEIAELWRNILKVLVNTIVTFITFYFPNLN